MTEQMLKASVGWQCSDGWQADLCAAPRAERQTPVGAPASPHHEAHACFSDNRDVDELIRTKLGGASSLFLALRARHPPTAEHSLRVAFACSSWSAFLGSSADDRDQLEVAALLHDVEKIGLPDHLLQDWRKGPVATTETIARDRERAREILGGGCCSPDVLDAVHYAPAWYDGSNGEFDRCRDQLPLGARMLAIVDAFDMLTAVGPGSPPLPREVAMSRLRERAGTQFDPGLIERFGDFLRTNGHGLDDVPRTNWLQNRDALPRFEAIRPKSVPPVRGELFDGLFYQHLVDSMHDGVVFVDAALRILKWNRSLELLTGVPARTVEHQLWDPGIVQLRDEHYKLIPADQCPVGQAVRDGTCSFKRALITDHRGLKVSVDACAMPVLGVDSLVCGATLLLTDASSRITLEERLHRLKERVARDGLTGVANRAEFDRVHARWVADHLSRGLPYSMMICDLDFFKRINDRYGHQAGDEILVAFATLLRENCRAGDVVARYGGEEFVMLCSDCNTVAAIGRAEAIREAWSQQPHRILNGRSLTVSFGVAELQPGDTGETMLQRADRALLQAKAAGRNTVVSLGGGSVRSQPEARQHRNWFSWRPSLPAQHVLQRRVVTTVPLPLAMAKLRGFVADHPTKILEIGENRLVLGVAGQTISWIPRRHYVPALLVEIDLARITDDGSATSGGESKTIIQITIRPRRQRDRRRAGTDERARHLFIAFRSYLMAQDYSELRV